MEPDCTLGIADRPQDRIAATLQCRSNELPECAMKNQSLYDYLHISKEVLHILAILVVAWLLMVVSRRVVRVFRHYMYAHAETAEEKRRVETLARIFHYVANVVILVIAFLLSLGTLGIATAPFLGAAGVVGVAVGFGAQSLIKDYFNGLFLLVENQIRQGDVVEVCGKIGMVEDITLRYVGLRDYEGNFHYIPNGLITTVTNKSRDYSFALIDVGVAYRENTDEVFGIMRDVARELRNDPEFREKILEDIEIAGVQDWRDSAVILRCRFKTVALEQWGVRREFLGRLKAAFDARGIEIPFPHLTLYAGSDKQGNAPAFRVLNRDRGD
jgi:small conductance mechanosensitive channel